MNITSQKECGCIVMPDPSNGCLTRHDVSRLADQVHQLDADETVRAILIHGAGQDFCRGLDIAEFAEESGYEELSRILERAFLAFANCSTPIFAAVRGEAAGFGLTMLLHAHYVAADNTARFSTPFVAMGLVPEAGSTFALASRIGERAAFGMLFLGDILNSGQALRLGLISAVHENGVEVGTGEAIRRFIRQPYQAVDVTRSMMADSALPMPTRIQQEIEASFQQLSNGGSRHLLRRLIQRTRKSAGQGRVA